MTLHRSQVALLHVAKRDLSLEDEDYRAILKRFGGAPSATELNEPGFDRVMAYFGALGFKSSGSKRSFGVRRGMATPAQVATIRNLWTSYHGEDANEAALNAWLQRFHHVSAVRFIDSQKAGPVITALKRMTARRRK